MYELKGKVALVTGAGRHKGLGQAIASRLADEGCDIVIADIGRPAGDQFPEGMVGTTGEMEEIVGELRGKGRKAIAVACDVRSEAQIRAAVEHAIAEFGHLDILVNNAGVGYLMQLIVDMTEENWDAVLDVNLKGMFLCTKHVARQMIKQGRGGRIINIASQAAKSAFPYAVGYVSSKHGVIGLTRVAALELGQYRITVNAVCPNHVTTGLGAWQNEFFSKAFGQTVEEYMASMRTRIPLGRPGRQEDIARTCAFLASDEAGYITGESINVSGGEEMH